MTSSSSLHLGLVPKTTYVPYAAVQQALINSVRSDVLFTYQVITCHNCLLNDICQAALQKQRHPFPLG